MHIAGRISDLVVGKVLVMARNTWTGVSVPINDYLNYSSKICRADQFSTRVLGMRTWEALMTREFHIESHYQRSNWTCYILFSCVYCNLEVKLLFNFLFLLFLTFFFSFFLKAYNQSYRAGIQRWWSWIFPVRWYHYDNAFIWVYLVNDWLLTLARKDATCSV